MRTKLYDVTDCEDNLVLESVTPDEIRKFVNMPNMKISDYLVGRSKLRDKYIIHETGRYVTLDGREYGAFGREWEKMRQMFKNVEWVTSGGKRLLLRKE